MRRSSQYVTQTTVQGSSWHCQRSVLMCVSMYVGHCQRSGLGEKHRVKAAGVRGTREARGEPAPDRESINDDDDERQQKNTRAAERERGESRQALLDKHQQRLPDHCPYIQREGFPPTEVGCQV